MTDKEAVRHLTQLLIDNDDPCHTREGILDRIAHGTAPAVRLGLNALLERIARNTPVRPRARPGAHQKRR